MDVDELDPRPAKPSRILLQVACSNASPEAVRRYLDVANHSALVGRSEGQGLSLGVELGSNTAIDIDQGAWATEFQHLDGPVLTVLETGLSPERIHNRLDRARSSGGLLALTELTTLPDARAVWRMAAAFDDPEVGLVYAALSPYGGPAPLVLLRRKTFGKVGRFTAAEFTGRPAYADLADRVTAQGLKVLTQPTAVAHRDERFL